MWKKVLYASFNGGLDLSHLSGGDGNLFDVGIKLLLLCSTLLLYTILFFGISMLVRTSKMCCNIGFFIILIIPLVQIMVANGTGIELINQIHLTVDIGSSLATQSAGWTLYASIGVFAVAGIISNVFAYLRMNKAEAQNMTKEDIF